MATEEEKPPTTIEEARAANARFAKTIARRNVRELVAGACVSVFFVFVASNETSSARRLGAILLALAVVPIAITLLVRGRNMPPPPDEAPLRDHVAHLRSELARQRDLLSRAWLWYVLPFIPGFVVLSWGFAARRPSNLVFNIVAFLPALAAVAWINRRVARKLDARIAALPS